MHRVLVTGCNGYIGSHLLPRLVARGLVPVGIDRRGESSPLLGAFHRADLTDRDAVRRALDGVDGVFHLAAAKDDWGVSEAEYFRDNHEATCVLVAEGERAGILDWIYFSTVSSIGATPRPMTEDDELGPIVPYGASKAAADREFESYARRNPAARVTLLRPSVVYGPGCPENTNIYRLIDALHRGRFVMIGDGRVVKTTSYMDNLLDATEFLLDRMRPGLHPFIVVDEPRLETGRLVETLCRLLGRRPPRVRLPLALAWPAAAVTDGLAAVMRRDLPITSARIRKFCRPTDFDPARIIREGYRQAVGNEEALRRTVAWYLATRAAGAIPRTAEKE